jgi:hypothetical protein
MNEKLKQALKILWHILFLPYYFWQDREKRYSQRPEKDTLEEKDILAEDSREDSELDGLMSEGDMWFPPEEDE